MSAKCNGPAIGWWCGCDGMLFTRAMIGGQPRDKLYIYGNILVLGSSMSVAKWQIGDKGWLQHIQALYRVPIKAYLPKSNCGLLHQCRLLSLRLVYCPRSQVAINIDTLLELCQCPGCPVSYFQNRRLVLYGCLRSSKDLVLCFECRILIQRVGVPLAEA